MNIHSIKIDGYKNLSNIWLELEDITTLMALNNYGKSNVLSGIDFGINFIKALPSVKNEMMSNYNVIPLCKMNRGNNYKFEIELSSKLNGETYYIIYGYEFSWTINSKDGPFIENENLKYRVVDKGQKYTQLINRTKNEALYKSSVTGRCSSKMNIELTELVINKLQAFDELFYLELIKEVNSLKFYMENSFDVSNFYNPDPIIRKGLEEFPIDSNNLPRVLYHLKDKYPDRYESLVNAYKILFKNVKEIEIKEYSIKDKITEKLPEDAQIMLSNAVYFLYIKDDNYVIPMDFSMMSDGAKRVFLILTRILLADITGVSLIAIEEPENSVHPSMLSNYINIIGDLMGDCKVIFTSHSPYIATNMFDKCVYVGVDKNDGIANFYKIKKVGRRSLFQEAKKYNTTYGDHLFALLADTDTKWGKYLDCEINE